MTHMLADVIDHGTAWKARQLGFKLPAAGKTGTTNDYRDAWFVGYTPRLVTGVWVGFDQPQTIIGGGYAAEVAVPLWAGFMKKATAGDPSEWYKAPSGVVTAQVCRLSGKRPVEGCYGAITMSDDGTYTNASSVYTEYFAAGTQPKESCPIHGYHRAAVDSRSVWTGGVYAPSAPAQERADVRRADDDGDDHDDEVRRADSRDEERQEAKEPEKKKRGFWSRIFGRGDKDDKGKKKDKNEDDDDKRRKRER
jgi:membrane carboxypeptidase/penicillin-binding protein